MKHFSEWRLIENEVIFRETNRSAKNFVQEEVGNATLQFFCECSRPDCTQRITLTTEQYEDLHRTDRHFIVIKGHEFPEVERIVKKEEGFNVVEKHDAPPSPDQITMALKKIEL